MLWYSSGKPWTTVAVLQLWEQGRLGLDDLVADYVDGWGDGKEAGDDPPRPHPHRRLPDGERPDLRRRRVVRRGAGRRDRRLPAVWEPGTMAGYHPASGWRVLGAIVERIDGRRIDHYLREEIAAPLGLDDCHLGIPLDVQRDVRRPARARLLDRAPVPVARRGRDPDGPVADRRGAQRAVAHREGRTGWRHARPGPPARSVLRVAARPRAGGARRRARSR